MKIIGISGYTNAGKDTFASLLLEFIGDACTVDSFGRPLHEVAAHMGMPTHRSAKELPCTRHYGDFPAALQRQLDYYLGYVEDNGRAELYALFLDALVGGGHLTLADEPIDGAEDELVISPRRFMQLLGEAGRKVRADFWLDALKARNAGRDGVLVISDVRFPEEREICDELIWIDRDRCGVLNDDPSEQHYKRLQRTARWSVYNNTLRVLRHDAAKLASRIVYG